MTGRAQTRTRSDFKVGTPAARKDPGSPEEELDHSERELIDELKQDISPLVPTIVTVKSEISDLRHKLTKAEAVIADQEKTIGTLQVHIEDSSTTR
jgi:peptidoglycan hydrolase CwlO-like protein